MRYAINLLPLHQNRNRMEEKNNIKDVLADVEAEARQKLKDPNIKGAAKTVLEYIERERKRLNKS